MDKKTKEYNPRVLMLGFAEGCYNPEYNYESTKESDKQTENIEEMIEQAEETINNAGAFPGNIRK